MLKYSRQGRPRQEPLPKVPKVPPPRPYDRTDKENAAIAAAELKAHLAPKTTAPKEVYTDKQKNWALGLVTHPSQIEINRPDDYEHTIRKGLPSTASIQKKKEVAQLGAQPKQSISPLKVQADQGSKAAKGNLSMEEAFAADAGITLSQLRDESVPISKGISWNWEYGKPLMPPDEIEVLPTQMHKLHRWYMEVTLTS